MSVIQLYDCKILHCKVSSPMVVVLYSYYLEGVSLPGYAGYCSAASQTARAQKEIQGGSGLL